MRNHRACAPALLLLALTALSLLPAVPAFAQLVEMEPNDSIGTANVVDFDAAMSDGEISIDGTRTAEDSDYFVLTQLEPGVEYRVENDSVLIGIGLFEANGSLIDSVAFASEQVLFGTADAGGELIVGVCGRLGNEQVLDCTSAGLPTSTVGYTVTVPEPDASWLAAAALFGLALIARRSSH